MPTPADYMRMHFDATISRLDRNAPDYQRLVERLIAERDREVSRLAGRK